MIGNWKVKLSGIINYYLFFYLNVVLMIGKGWMVKLSETIEDECGYEKREKEKENRKVNMGKMFVFCHFCMSIRNSPNGSFFP